MEEMALSIDQINTMDDDTAHFEFTRCCGSSSWVSRMIQRRPFSNSESMFTAADEVWRGLSSADWKEAFSHHPRIGDIKAFREKLAATWAWADGEQAGTRSGSEQTLEALAVGNAEYEKKFGYIFIVCATGKNADEILSLLILRSNNEPAVEIHVAAEEQRKITQLRLQKLLDLSA